MAGIEEQSALPARLRQLRAHQFPVPVTQGQLARAMRVSPPTISAWENGTQVPPEDRLRSLALFYATPRSLDGPSLLDVAALTKDEERVRRDLIDELVRLREAQSAPAQGRQADANFYRYSDGLPVRIIGSRLSAYELLPSPPSRELVEAARRLRRDTGNAAPAGVDEALEALERYVDHVDVLRHLVDSRRSQERDPDDPDWRLLARGFEGGGVQYANPWHPNAVHSLWQGDMDSVIELHGHIRAENPNSDVRWLLDSEVQADDLTGGHLVILGAGANPGPGAPLDYVRRRLNLPVLAETSTEDPEFGGSFVVTLDERGDPHVEGTRREQFCPLFVVRNGERVVDHGEPVLDYDVALLARAPNPLNLEATITVASGVFSRGTYGAVRALTDANLRVGNQTYLSEHLDVTKFWMLLRVPVFNGPTGAKTVTPDLTRPFHRLRSSI